MNPTAKDLLALARHTVSEPRVAARALMSFRLDMQTRWIGLALTSVLSALTLYVSLQFFSPAALLLLPYVPGPFESAVSEAILIVLAAVLAHRIGRWQGGQGSFADALLLMIWLQAILLGIQLLQIAALLVLPPLASILGFVGMGLLLWMLTGFVAELHGFRSLGKVLAGIVVAGVVVLMLVSVLLIPFVSAGG